jgi:gluconokinase
MADREEALSVPILVMGVTACGKSEIASRLAAALDVPFVEGDALHPPSNIQKMARGEPLDDDDRWPWLEALASEVANCCAEQGGAVFSCSALKRTYRHLLRNKLPNLMTVFLELDPETSQKRSSARAGHFMPVSLVESQFATLERPVDETNTFIVDARLPIDDVLDQVQLGLGAKVMERGN